MSLQREAACVEAWPDCVNGEYNPACCRFPKSCSVQEQWVDSKPSVEPATGFTVTDEMVDIVADAIGHAQGAYGVPYRPEARAALEAAARTANDFQAGLDSVAAVVKTSPEEVASLAEAAAQTAQPAPAPDERTVGERWLAGEVPEDKLLGALILEDREKRAEHERKCAGYWRNGKCTVHPDVSRDPEPVTRNALIAAYVERMAGGSRQVIAENLREFASKIEHRQLATELQLTATRDKLAGALAKADIRWNVSAMAWARPGYLEARKAADVLLASGVVRPENEVRAEHMDALIEDLRTGVIGDGGLISRVELETLAAKYREFHNLPAAADPKDSSDLTGWTEITCWQAELVRRRDLQVISSRTDVDASDVFTEWWIPKTEDVKRTVPVLREYRDRNGCRHYLAGLPAEAALVGGE